MSELDPLPSCNVHVHRLDPTLAELHITFTDLPDDVEVRGRLMGPRCPGTSTVEFRYEPRSVRIGGGISFAALAILALLVIRERRRVRREANSVAA